MLPLKGALKSMPHKPPFVLRISSVGKDTYEKATVFAPVTGDAF